MRPPPASVQVVAREEGLERPVGDLHDGNRVVIELAVAIIMPRGAGSFNKVSKSCPAYEVDGQRGR